MAESVEQLYGELWGKPASGFEDRINQSLSPRGPEILYRYFKELGVAPSDTVLDIGCRDAGHAVRIVKELGCRAIAIDLVPIHLERAQRHVAEMGVPDRVRLLHGRIESLPLHSESISHIWCRDMLSHVALRQALDECSRVLRPGGAMLIYQTFATELLEPREAARLFQALAIVPDNMSCDYFEATVQGLGFAIDRKEVIGSEWREYGLERGEDWLVEELLQVARMRRLEEELVSRFGRARFEAAHAGDLWGAYQLLGKLCPTVHVLRKP